jgi:hypothetical protein
MPTIFNRKAADKMICLRCGHKMNHHCDKMVNGGSADDTAELDPLTGGVITEFHSCPNCGAAASRNADN